MNGMIAEPVVRRTSSLDCLNNPATSLTAAAAVSSSAAAGTAAGAAAGCSNDGATASLSDAGQLCYRWSVA